ncbi:MAG: hypothetical protein ACRDAM_04395, partial [Casimicrobium sp.]
MALAALGASFDASAQSAANCPFNADQRGVVNLATDGLLFVRYALGQRGTPLTSGATQGSVAAADVEDFIRRNTSTLDIDGNRKFESLDAQLIARYLAGLRGASLASGLSAKHPALRSDASAFERFIESGCNTALPICTPSYSCGFSDEVGTYATHPTSQTRTAQEIVNRLEVPSRPTTQPVKDKRVEIAQMYKDAGYDLSLGNEQGYQSNALDALKPSTWSSQTPEPLSGNYALPYSIDSTYYKRIPRDVPRVELPTQYFRGVQINTVKGFDGLGYGLAISDSIAPTRKVRDLARAPIDPARYTFSMKVRDDVLNFLSTNQAGDLDMTLIDATNNKVLHAFRFGRAPDAAFNSNEYHWQGAFVADPYTLPNLGDKHGTVATGTSDLIGLIRKGELTQSPHPIRHALSFATNRMWRARVYPAARGDADVWNANPVTDVNGLVPYGALVQLDPEFDLSTQNLSQCSRRILEALQTYGAYNVNVAGPDFNIYTNTDASEYDACGGI